MDEGKIRQALSESALLERAMDSTSEGITIGDMTSPDRPLIYVNSAFEKLTGYTKDEVLGRNCRFLQGPGTCRNSIDQIRKAILNGEECTVELLNYKKDGDSFWNRLSITPLKDEFNQVTHYVGIQSDITELKKTKERLEIAIDNLKKFQNNILEELDQARLAQEFILPRKLPQSSNIKFASLFVPMEQIGGDFYDVISIEEDLYGVLIADVTGHGIPGALLTFMSSTTFKNTAPGILSPSLTLEITNKKLFGKMPDDAFVTMFYGIYNPNKKEFTYTQAGHPEAYVLRPQAEKIISLTTGGTLVGVFANDEITFSEKALKLEIGDKVIFYTDAIMDAFDHTHSTSEENHLKSFLIMNAHRSLEDLFDEIYAEGLRISGANSYPDDFTLVGFEVLN